jgi:transposase-like protein
VNDSWILQEIRQALPLVDKQTRSMAFTGGASDKTKTVAHLPAACHDEATAVEFLEAQRWGDSHPCPRCGSADGVYQMEGKDGKRSPRFLWRCRDCNGQHTVRIGSIFEDSKIPLRHWCYAFWAACASKKGVSALQIKRMTGLSYKSSLCMMHRVRFAMFEGPTDGPTLSGDVEVDETYVGGKPRYKGIVNKGRMGRGTDKFPVLAIVQRGGKVRAMSVAAVTSKNLKEEIRKHVAKTATIYTDEAPVYNGLESEFEGGHKRIKHQKNQYVDGNTHTNTVEGFFSLLKRGMFGTFHSVSREHLHRYIAEFEFRYNTRKLDDGARTVLAIKGAEGKRLLYRQPSA